MRRSPPTTLPPLVCHRPVPRPLSPFPFLSPPPPPPPTHNPVCVRAQQQRHASYQPAGTARGCAPQARSATSTYALKSAAPVAHSVASLLMVAPQTAPCVAVRSQWQPVTPRHRTGSEVAAARRQLVCSEGPCTAARPHGRTAAAVAAQKQRSATRARSRAGAAALRSAQDSAQGSANGGRPADLVPLEGSQPVPRHPVAEHRLAICTGHHPTHPTTPHNTPSRARPGWSGGATPSELQQCSWDSAPRIPSQETRSRQGVGGGGWGGAGAGG